MSDELNELLNSQDGRVERIVPSAGIHDQALEAEHLARYRWAAGRLGSSMLVLDIASGVGYGTPILSREGNRTVISSDISTGALAYGRRTFSAVGVAADGTNLPFGDDTFDAIVSLETIEHVPRPDLFIRELRRVLKPSGSLLVSTPNAEETGGGNPHHLKEFSREEFVALVSDSGFTVRKRFAQHYRATGRAWAVPGLRRAAWEVRRSPRVFPDVRSLAVPLQFCWDCAPVSSPGQTRTERPWTPKG
jgi:SAM-dependent methyltransferase